MLVIWSVIIHLGEFRRRVFCIFSYMDDPKTIIKLLLFMNNVYKKFSLDIAIISLNVSMRRKYKHLFVISLYLEDEDKNISLFLLRWL